MKNNLKLSRIIGHRGLCAYAPENTLASIQKARELGLLWFEVDVRLTRDDVVMLFHDETLERTSNGKGLFRERSLDEIKQLDAGSWFLPKFSKEVIPTLEEVLEFCGKLKININLELKLEDKSEERLCALVLKEVRKSKLNYSTSFLLSSFSLEILKKLKMLDSEIPLGWNRENWSEEDLFLVSGLKPYSLHYPADVLTADRILEIKSKGIAVLAYTVNTKSEADRLFAMGVESVFSDSISSL